MLKALYPWVRRVPKCLLQRLPACSWRCQQQAYSRAPDRLRALQNLLLSWSRSTRWFCLERSLPVWFKTVKFHVIYMKFHVSNGWLIVFKFIIYPIYYIVCPTITLNFANFFLSLSLLPVGKYVACLAVPGQRQKAGSATWMGDFDDFGKLFWPTKLSQWNYNQLPMVNSFDCHSI